MKKVLIPLIVVSMVIAVGVLVFTNRFRIIDYVISLQYEPSTSVANIAERTTMTPEGTRLFYAGQPALLNNDEFNRHCQRAEEASAILGCYSVGRIYVYDVQRDELDGVREVTAVHEMLHLIWERMSASERERIGALLEDVYASLDDSELRERMDYYARQQPGTHVNELHSILGTEVANLPDELEVHYATYFSNRKAIVQLHEKYHEVFTEAQTRVEELESELTRLKTAVQDASESYQSGQTAVMQRAQALNGRASSIDRTNPAAIAAYNDEAADVNAQISRLNAQYDQIIADTRRYNVLVAEYNKTVLYTNDLYKSIDSTVEPLPQI